MRHRLGIAVHEMHAAEGIRAGEVFAELFSDPAEAARWQAQTRVAVNHAFVDPATVLRDGDEVALIPPVSGG